MTWVLDRSFVRRSSCHVGRLFCASVGTSHVSLDASSVLRCSHFMLRCTRPRSFSGRPTFTLDIFFPLLALRWAHFILRWARRVGSGGHTPCYVGHVLCTSVGILLVALPRSLVLPWIPILPRWTRPLHFVGHTSWYVRHDFDCSVFCHVDVFHCIKIVLRSGGIALKFLPSPEFNVDFL